MKDKLDHNLYIVPISLEEDFSFHKFIHNTTKPYIYPIQSKISTHKTKHTNNNYLVHIIPKKTTEFSSSIYKAPRNEKLRRKCFCTFT